MAEAQTIFYKFTPQPLSEDQRQSTFQMIHSSLGPRTRVFADCKDGWLCFFDHDCLPSDDLVRSINEKLKNLDPNIVLAGSYSNPAKASLLQRAHNFVCNTWLVSDTSLSVRSSKVLGGFFALYRNESLRQLDFSEAPRWGGEDAFMARQLVQAGRQILVDPTLCVTHDTSKKISHFLKRAWLHGWNHSKYDLNPHVLVHGVSEKTIQLNRKKFWQKQLRTQSFPVRFCVALHFSILTLAKLTQQILRKRSS